MKERKFPSNTLTGVIYSFGPPHFITLELKINISALTFRHRASSI